MIHPTTSAPISPDFRYTQEILLEETRKDWGKITKEVPNKSMQLEPIKKEVARAFQGYQCALNGQLPFMILGDETLRSEQSLLNNVGTLATEPQTDQKVTEKFLKEVMNIPQKDRQFKEVVKTHLTQGAVLNDSNWWLYRNDLFMLGAIHARKEFHIASKRGVEPRDDQLWDKENGYSRVLGRELVMLEMAGYKRVQGPSKLGIVFTPPREGTVAPLTLTQCRQRFAELKSAADIRGILGNQVTNTCARNPVSNENAPADQSPSVQLGARVTPLIPPRSVGVQKSIDLRSI